MTTDTVRPFATRKLGYDKVARTFHLRDADGTKQDFTSLEGWVLFDGAEGEAGRLILASTVDDEGHLDLPADAAWHRADVPDDARYADWWQCCFIRKQNQFRIWPAGLPSSEREAQRLYFDDIWGPAFISWFDRGGHIYIHGRIWTREEDGRTMLYVAGDEPPTELGRK